MFSIIQIIATVLKKKRLGFDSILLTIKRITQSSQRVITASTYHLELCFSLFLPISHWKSQFIVKIFRNGKFSQLRISCTFTSWLLRTEACAEQPKPQNLCGRDWCPRSLPGVTPLTKKPEDSGLKTRLELKTNGFDVIGVNVFLPPTLNEIPANKKG